jgi:MtaA/CmuA family methyltransferase
MNPIERILSMVAGKPTDSLPLMPITMMFAADQIGRSYYDYATDHRVMAEAQIRTAEKFDFDHVSCISDPARETGDCGGKVKFFPDQPPAIIEEDALLAEKTVLVTLKQPDPLGGGRMHDRVRAAALLKKRVGSQKLVEGWIDGPCALGSDFRGINRLMLDYYDDPTFVHDLFAFVTEVGRRFAHAQVQAGADLIGLGDAAASLVGPAIYEEFIWPYEKQLIDAIHAMGVPVRLHICGNTRPLLEKIGQLGCDIVDLDYPVPVKEARAKMGPQQVLLGNLDPVRILRNGTPEMIQTAISQCHREAGPRFIVGAGCEIPRDTNPQHVHILSSYARGAN